MGKQRYSNFLTLRVGVYDFFGIIKSERKFILLICALLLCAVILSPFKEAAMWFGFALAGYSAVANDSIQTIGTFIVSNQHRKWWVLWLFIGIIFIVTVSYSFIIYHGDVSFQRLNTPGLDLAPTNFTIIQLAAPLVLIVLTRMRMPVSTTFLLLTIFSTKSSAVVSIFSKSIYGYFIAFFSAILIWYFARKFVKLSFKGKPHLVWTIIQWITSGTLWSVWIIQDAANIAVFLPRTLTITQFLVFTLFIFLGIGLLFYLKGDRIQKIVSEKAGIADIRAATIVDLVYAIILIYFSQVSQIPMSTTWVFLGLLGGRELAISITKKNLTRRKVTAKRTFQIIGKDLLKASIGLLISLILAISINEEMRKSFLGLF